MEERRQSVGKRSVSRIRSRLRTQGPSEIFGEQSVVSTSPTRSTIVADSIPFAQDAKDASAFSVRNDPTSLMSMHRTASNSAMVQNIEDIQADYEEQLQMKEELLKDYQLLVENIRWTLEHIEDDTSMPVAQFPDIFSRSDQSIIKDQKLVAALEGVIFHWEKQIMRTIETYNAKQPNGNGPIAEYDYWREREAALSVLFEPLKKNVFHRITKILEAADSPIINGFQNFFEDLRKAYSLARDNVKFLFTILRHFKTMTYCEDFVITKEAIPHLYDGLQLMWVLSNNYCIDETMVPLLERVSYVLCEKSRAALDNSTLFRRPIKEITKLAQETREMLKTWKECYLDTREKIEMSGKTNRWEFDKKKLFGESDYIILVCKDIENIADVSKTIIY